MSRPRILGEVLVASGAIGSEALEQALTEQGRGGGRLGEILVRQGLVTDDVVARSLAVQLGLSYAPPPLEPDAAATDLVPADLAMARATLPLTLDGRSLQVAVSDPLAHEALDDLRFLTGRRIDPVVTTRQAILDGLEKAYGGGLTRLVASLSSQLSGESDAEGSDLEEVTRSAPVVRLVDRVLRQALDEGASDIHVEETGADVRVRYRVDGVLRPAVEIPAAARRAVVSRMKVMAGMDISVRRRPQDGALTLHHHGARYVLRVSTLPVNGGEKAVARILDPGGAPGDLGALGLAPDDLTRLRRILGAREGLLLATGPTGSGKSTTIFAALSEIDRAALNVTTLEDPVEYRLPGVNQIEMDPRAGLTFATGLRSVLRQDPDVVMVGEIRDRETAEIAMAAAVTGHLVLSTLHTTDAPGAVTRLLDMGVPPYLVAGGLTGVVAQRLVRRVCPTCAGRGCPSCHEGLKGRTGIFQVLILTDRLRDEITAGGGTARLRQFAAEAGMRTLAEDARRAVAERLTTPHEITRVLHAEPGRGIPCPACGHAVPLDGTACPGCGRQRKARCRCGSNLESGWRYCPQCIRKVA